MKIIAALIGAYLIYILERFLYRRFWKRNLEVELTLSDHKAVEGEQLILYETVRNQKLLPIPVLKVKFTTSRYLSFLDLRDTEVTDRNYRNDVISVMMYQKLTRSLPFLCSKRGFYTIDKLALVCSDLLLESELVTDYDLNVSLYVYPKPIDFAKFEIPFRSMLGTVLTKRFINEDPFEFKNIREYQSYDTMTKINWKASAKTGSLMVNVYDHTASQRIKILLNLEAETLLHYEELEEESIRLAAAFAERFIEQGIPTSVYTNGRDCVTKELLKVPAGSGSNHLRSIHETLARIDTSLPIPTFTDALWEELNEINSDDYILLISFYQRKDLLEQLLRLSQDKVDFSWIVPVNTEVKLTVSGELEYHILSWEIGGAA
jgi:uncharacterized protein (DUF58 family)